MRTKRDSRREFLFSLLVILLGIFLLVFSLAFLSRFSWLRIDFYLLLVIILGLFDLRGGGLLIALLWGLLMDTFSGYFLGPHIITYPLGFFFVRALQAKFLFRRPLEGVLLTFWVVLLLEGLLIFIIRFVYAGEVGEGFFSRLLYQAVALALLFPVFWSILKKMRLVVGLAEEL